MKATRKLLPAVALPLLLASAAVADTPPAVEPGLHTPPPPPHRLSTGQVLGIVIGVAAVFVLLALALYCLCGAATAVFEPPPLPAAVRRADVVRG